MELVTRRLAMLQAHHHDIVPVSYLHTIISLSNYFFFLHLNYACTDWNWFELINDPWISCIFTNVWNSMALYFWGGWFLILYYFSRNEFWDLSFLLTLVGKNHKLHSSHYHAIIFCNEGEWRMWGFFFIRIFFEYYSGK